MSKVEHRANGLSIERFRNGTIYVVRSPFTQRVLLSFLVRKNGQRVPYKVTFFDELGAS